LTVAGASITVDVLVSNISNDSRTDRPRLGTPSYVREEWDNMSRNSQGGDGGSVHLRKLDPGTIAGRTDEYPGEAGPGSIGVVVGRDESAREQLEGLLDAA